MVTIYFETVGTKSVVAVVVLQDCGDDMLGCALIRCDTGAMVDKDDSVIIQIRSRVYTNTLILVGLARSHARTPCKHSTRFIVIIMTVMVVSPLAASYGDRAATDAGTVADMTATRKTEKYRTGSTGQKALTAALTDT